MQRYATAANDLNRPSDATLSTASSAVTLFDYDIRYTLTRHHFNPPVGMTVHPHDFRITLELRAQRCPPGIYGLDMVQIEQQLKQYAEQLPPVVNDHPDVSTGTTEQLCEYFSKIPLAAHIQLLSVSVAECPERVTRFICH